MEGWSSRKHGSHLVNINKIHDDKLSSLFEASGFRYDDDDDDDGYQVCQGGTVRQLKPAKEKLTSSNSSSRSSSSQSRSRSSRS